MGMVGWLLQHARDQWQRSLHRDRSRERQVLALSHFLWPWQERWLLPLVGLLVGLDYFSTYVMLGLSGKLHIYEDGPLAGWALRTGGFGRLLWVELVAVGALCLGAITARYFYTRFGLKGYGRAAFVLLLLPYSFAALLAFSHNLVLAL